MSGNFDKSVNHGSLLLSLKTSVKSKSNPTAWLSVDPFLQL